LIQGTISSEEILEAERIDKINCLPNKENTKARIAGSIVEKPRVLRVFLIDQELKKINNPPKPDKEMLIQTLLLKNSCKDTSEARSTGKKGIR